MLTVQELQNLIDEANQSLEESGTPSHEIMVIVLHREFNGGSIGITLAGGADYETKEITVRGRKNHGMRGWSRYAGEVTVSGRGSWYAG